MALSLSTVWEVRTVGSDTNGGGFVTGAAGTDYSQQNAAQYALTNGVTNGTTTIATVSAAADMVGNIVYVAGGTGAITGGWYQITAQSLGVSITVDRSTGLTAGTGVTLNIGGALASLAQMFTNFSVAGMTAYVKATATYSISTGLTANTATTNTTVNRVIGYTTTRTDLGIVTVQATAAITMLAQSTNGWSLENLIFDGNGTGTNGINSTGTLRLSNVVVKNLTGYGITSNSNTTRYFDRVEVTGCGTTGGIVNSQGFIIINECYVHDNTIPGITTVDRLVLLNSVVESNSGASSDGLTINTSLSVILIAGSVFYNNGRDGVRVTPGGMPGLSPVIVNNIFDSNGGWGINDTTGPAKQIVIIRANAFRNNTSGQVTPFSMLNAVTLTGIPFTDAPNGDFTLNNTAGAGAACRAAGSPGSFIGLAALGYRDIGTFQHQDSGSGAISVSCVNAVILNRFGIAGY